MDDRTDARGVANVCDMQSLFECINLVFIFAFIVSFMFHRWWYGSAPEESIDSDPVEIESFASKKQSDLVAPKQDLDELDECAESKLQNQSCESKKEDEVVEQEPESLTHSNVSESRQTLMVLSTAAICIIFMLSFGRR